MQFLAYVDHKFMHPPIVSTRKGGSFYASHASLKVKNIWDEWEVEGTCLRAQWYRLKGKPRGADSEDPDGRRMMDYGNVIHEYEIERIKRSGTYIDDEIAFYDEAHNISGRVDAIVYNPMSKSEPKEMMGVELKTVGGVYTSGGALVPGPKGFGPKPQHLLQTMVYADYYKDGISTWLILYFDRSSGKSAQHIVILTPDGVSVNGQLRDWKIENIYKRWELLTGYLEEDELPPTDYTMFYNQEKLDVMLERQQLTKTQCAMMKSGKPLAIGDAQCRWCNFSEECDPVACKAL